ncbi:hypothetical protein ISF_08984 [Cordyceps fumosorosea ARSEF 2679]|uniref:ubiquitinyl hydrolase 1 n=1 Tax=Cordyceps fumosorosea (strain ARSEF 2679) TaxID=1081104 RepID=A0A167LIY6_CORFA|nr:hypothetical protein ISF_08984 [Cordyceps fumosorosea ARSEF 2679]OAA53143.1 hypothetical protein ISF_08984 [Cordyceps fumosorosea ARSEF 2679]
MASQSHDESLLEAVFNHMVLPPKLPDAPEADSIPLSWDLTERLIRACKHLQDPEADMPWKMIEVSLRLSRDVLPPISKETLAVALSAIADGDGSECLALHVAQQNAAMILYKNKKTEEVTFEAFEVSPSTGAVLDTHHALRCAFPCRAVAIPAAELADPSFCDALADFTEQAADTALDRFAARACKGGATVVEVRDTPSPALITEMLFSFLEAIGRPVPAHTVQKRVRDDVVLGSAERPWRRSPYWLMLRVFVQRVIAISCLDEGRSSRLSFKLVMCVVLAHLLSDCQNHIEPEKVLMLQAKLCRRLAKLENELKEVSSPQHDGCGAQFAQHRPFFQATVTEARRSVEGLWEQYKKRAARPIPKLPWNADPADLVLKLSNSEQRLKLLLSASVAPPKRAGSRYSPSQAEGTVMQVNNLAARYASVVSCAERAMLTLKKTFGAADEACIELSGAMTEYMDVIHGNFAEDAILASHHLLNLFELWVAMDSAAVKMCPLLERYHPSFAAEALDLLCFMSRGDMERLRLIQAYLDKRIKLSGGEAARTIFSDPNHGASFPAAYMDADDDESSRMALLMARIEQASDESEATKRRELVKVMAQYETLSAEMKTGTCVCKRLPDGTLDVRGCRRCYKARCRYRLRVQVHEGFMPRGRPKRAAVLLELGMPEYLIMYRDATWRLRMLGHDRSKLGRTSAEPAILVAKFAPLRRFARKDGVRSTLTLASRNKAYLQTHFRKLKLPKTANEVLLPFGPAFTYYDAENGLWLDECGDTPWYHHMLGPWLPGGIADPFADAALYMCPGEHPSSYETCATQDQHPAGMSRQEFAAYQTVMAGTYRRWIGLTMELGSSNLNLSSSATQRLFSRLALQSGPRKPQDKLDALGEVHSVFHDDAFCTSLAHQTRQLLKALESGRRDLEAMSIAVTLTLRLLSLGPESIQTLATELLQSIRHLLSLWISQLREEVRCTSDGEIACKVASNAFRASLLSRQTFRTCLAVSECPSLSQNEALQFLRASVALSESLIVNLDAIPKDLEQLLAQDMTWAALGSTAIRAWTLANTEALGTIINETWADAGGSNLRSFSEWTSCEDGEWLTSRTAATALVSSQTVHYHPLRGHLLIDGKALGRLPLDIRQDAGLVELFPGQHLLTRSSGVAGMEYQIINGSAAHHEVHVGLRHGSVVIRARTFSHLLEYIPRDMFRGDAEPDLPTGLIDGCVHWLNLQTGELEMRRKPSIWAPKSSNWVLNVRNRTAVRGRFREGGTRLVEPQSRLGRTIADIFRHFEDPGNLTIYQPLSDVGRLSVEIKRLEMRFFVNRKGLLQSIQLKSEIDPVQDVGTLHGLQSKIVLRNTANPRRKSVMVPIGSGCAWQRDGPHVAVRVENQGIYALFAVDPVLGRLKCAPEPALLYLQALLHALTSFPLPDELTGRTGTEEACRCLTAARGQPWKSLNVLPKAMLAMIQNVSPKRKYYPPTMRLYQRVAWDDSLTATIQHEQLDVLAAEILHQSDILGAFDRSAEDHDQDTVSTEPPKLHHLALRGLVRRQVYERSKLSSDSELLLQARNDSVHRPRGVEFRDKESTRVYQTVKWLRAESSTIPKPKSLSKMLKRWSVMDGFLGTFSTLDIARVLSIETCQAFGPLVQRLRAPDAASDYMTQLSLALFAYSREDRSVILHWLVAIATTPELKEPEPPTTNQFREFKQYQGFDVTKVQLLIASCQADYATYQSRHSTKQQGKKKKKLAADLYSEDTYTSDIAQESGKLASKLQSCWPDLPLTRQAFNVTCSDLALKMVDIKRTWDALGADMRQLTHNHALSEYAASLAATAQQLRNDGHAYGADVNVQWRHAMAKLTSSSGVLEPSLRQVHSITELLRRCRVKNSAAPVNVSTNRASLSETQRTPNADILQRLPAISKELTILFDLVQPFKLSQDIMQKQYGEDLENSIAAMAAFLEKSQARPLPMSFDSVVKQIDVAERSVKIQVSTLHDLLAKQSPCHLWLREGRMWPCDSLTALLEQLRANNYNSFSPGIQHALVSLGLSVSKLQHLQRIHHARLSLDDKTLRQETTNWGHSNWNPSEYPEWLLLEIDNDILIRPVQVDVAKAIISPQSRRNSVLQMNMGTGKTSVVIPMAAIVLADTCKLCRVVVPKSLLLQTAQVLQSRIGGLVGRRLRHVPYSRRSPCDASILSRYHRMHTEMLQTGGIMLCLPEHILSFKLSGLQRLVDRRPELGRRMLQIQAWLQDTCRDVLDESDMTLSVYTQLIYPSGQLATLDGHSHRWLVVEHLLGLVESHSARLQKMFEGQVVVVQRSCGYPIFHFITKHPENALNSFLADDVCNGRLPQLQIRESAGNAKDVVRAIIIGSHVSASEWDSAIQSLKDESFGAKTLYLLRGLISQRILILCLKKRWNIQYGLHPERQPIAVPFEAKGIPSQAAEYGHPDTTLILTCLTFYQQGLSKEQLKQGLLGVMQSDDAAAQYDRWTCSCATLPPSFRCWNMLDPENDAQVDALWGYLRFDRTVINHHLNTYIFPAHAKQYPVKLCASGWDIPLLSQEEEGRDGAPDGLTTGFSGTNDNKRILPQTIRQNDSPQLLHTNAEVLCHLLESRNSDCYLTMEGGRRFGEEDTLRFLCRKGIRILIDAGAHILEMENQDVARTWLSIDPQAEGAVYFGANSQIMVRSRFQKDPMPLIASPFAGDLEKCVVYIDEGHTRGTDLNLPSNAKGAVTLGLGQTKDQAVQAAMRLRQLGTTQSVAFLTPPEVHCGIIDLRAAHTAQGTRHFVVTSRDVVRWLLDQSCKANEQMLSLYLSQCHNFCRRADILWQHPDHASNDNSLSAVLGVVRQDEQQTLQQMYGPQASDQQMPGSVELTSPRLQGYVRSVTQMARHGQLTSTSALMQVEQEREVVLQVEHMRAKETRAQHVALEFPGLDAVIARFAETGELDTQEPVLQAFDYVGKTRLGARFGIQATASRLYVSREYCRTVAADATGEGPDIVRPVHWILWNPSSETALIIIPEEADAVIPLLRATSPPRVWLLAYATPVTKSMHAFHCLAYLTEPRWPLVRELPAWLGVEVGIISGRLYFPYAEYGPLLEWLGLPDAGGHLGGGGRPPAGGRNSDELLAFLQAWLAFRRRTEDVLYTPVGFVCQGQRLAENHFFFSSTTRASAGTELATEAGI